jgi:hypothetical protein
VQLDLREVFVIADELATHQRLIQTELRDGLARQRDEFHTISSRLESLSLGESLQRVTSLDSEDADTALSRTPTLADADGHEASQRRTSVESVNSNLTLSRTSTLVNTNGDDFEPISYNLSKSPGAEAALLEACQSTATTGIGIRTAHFSRSPCERWCSCVCHKGRTLRSPQLFDLLVGKLFVGYSGLPLSHSKCDQRSCHSQSQRLAYITYYFPHWFLAQMVSLLVTTMPLTGLTVALSVQRTVPANADIFAYTKLGDVEKIADLFKNGLASPNDVHYETGVTALNVRLPFSQQHTRHNQLTYK